MKGIIWYSEKDTGLKQFKDICKKYTRLNIACVQKYQTFSMQFFAEFENGDVWRAVPAIDQSRGHACNIAYIDKNISQEVVNKVIMPCIKLLPYRAYYYY